METEEIDPGPGFVEDDLSGTEWLGDPGSPPPQILDGAAPQQPGGYSRVDTSAGGSFPPQPVVQGGETEMVARSNTALDSALNEEIPQHSTWSQAQKKKLRSPMELSDYEFNQTAANSSRQNTGSFNYSYPKPDANIVVAPAQPQYIGQVQPVAISNNASSPAATSPAPAAETSINSVSQTSLKSVSPPFSQSVHPQTCNCP